MPNLLTTGGMRIHWMKPPSTLKCYGSWTVIHWENEMIKLVGEIRSIVTMLGAATDVAAQAILEGDQETLLKNLELIHRQFLLGSGVSNVAKRKIK